MPKIIKALAAWAIVTGVYAHEIVPWNEGLAAMRESTHEQYALYIGRSDARLLRELEADERDWDTLFIHLSSDMEAVNPLTGRTVPGSQLIANFTGPVNDLTGGSILWFDKAGVLQPELTLIQNFHRNRLPVLELYARYGTSDLRERVSLADFGRLEGMPIARTLVMEVQSGDHADFSHLIGSVEMEGAYLDVVLGGERIDIRRKPSIYVLTHDGQGAVFNAQVQEIWTKMAIETANGTEQPPIIIVGPEGTRCPALDLLQIEYQVAVATAEDLAAFPSPTVVLPGSGDGRRNALEIRGFFPGEQVASVILPDHMHALIEDRRVLHPDIPIGEVDIPAGR